MIASMFWKKTIQGSTGCDQLTVFDSSSCSRKLPAVWKNFFGMIGARSRVSASGTRSPVSSAPPRSKYSRIVGTSSTAISSPSSTPTRLSSANVTSFIQSSSSSSCDATHARGDSRVHLGGADEPVDLEVLAELDVHQPGRGAVVHGRDVVAGQRRRVREPAGHVAAGRRPEDLLVRSVDRRHELVALLDLCARSGDVHLALDAVLGEPIGEAAHHLEHLPPGNRHPLRRRHAYVQEEIRVVRRPRYAPAEAALD